MAPSPPSRTKVRRAWDGVRGGRPPTNGTLDAAPDPAVFDLVSEPFGSIDDAHERLCALEALFHERGDRRGPFLVIYSRVTREVGRAVEAGEFADPAWVEAYLVTFADLYRQALLSYETGELETLADPWQVAFEAAGRGDCLVAQDAVLGINAHVNYDLALALSLVGVDPDREAKYADHCAVNDVLRRLVDEVQDRLADRYAPGIARVDESLGRLDEVLSFVALAEGRDSAWRTAVAISDSRLGIRRRAALWFLRTSSTGVAYLLLSPAVSDRLHETLRDVERGPGVG
ncbi:DUF5995 family protein [Salinigranum sp. GCM10025319]|uniref:DUF5995 family protein n=1 Tax=Salinigranum sp. GCM10025319 TaxID=3252687 RepID=UPI00362205B1